MSQKLEASLKKIEKVFYRAQLHGLTRSKKKQKNEVSNSNTSYKGYEEKTKTFLRYCHREYGLADVTKITQDMAENFIYEKVARYFEGDMSEAKNISGYINAIRAFREFSTETKVFKHELRFDDLKEVKEEMKEMKIKRTIASSTRRQSTRDEAFGVIEKMEVKMYQTRTGNKSQTIKSANIAVRYGARARAVLRLTKDDINLERKTITFRNDKGKKTRTVRIQNDEDFEYAKQLVAEAQKDGKIVQFHKKNGDFLSNDSAVKEINRATRSNSAHLTREKTVSYTNEKGEKATTTVVENFTTHSFRKAYAHQQIHYYLGEIKAGRLDDVLKDFAGREDIDKILEKLAVERRRINGNKDERFHRHRDLNDAELALFFASVDMGHYRVDVMSYYINRKEFIKNNK